MSFLVDLDVEVRVITWCLFGEYQREAAIRQPVCHSARVKLDFVTVFFGAHPLVSARDFLLLFLGLKVILLFLPVLDRELNNVKRVFEELRLDRLVNTLFHVETRSMVYLKHPRFQVCVQHHVEPQQLEAAVGLLLLTRAVDVRKLGLDGQDCLDDHRLNVLPYFVSLALSTWLPLLVGRLGHRPTETVTHFELVCVAIKLLVLLVERVVRQVLVNVF